MSQTFLSRIVATWINCHLYEVTIDKYKFLKSLTLEVDDCLLVSTLSMKKAYLIINILYCFGKRSTYYRNYMQNIKKQKLDNLERQIKSFGNSRTL